MKRLIDHDVARNPVAAEAARLARSASFIEPGLEQRIRAALVERDRPRRAWRLQSVVAVALLVALVTIAGATAVRGWVKRASSVRSRDAQHEEVVTRPKLSTNSTPASPVVVSPVAAGLGIATEAHLPAVAEPIAGSRTTGKSTAAAQPEPGVSRAATTTQVDDSAQPKRRSDPLESVLVVDATHALRYEHDPARALKLLEQYLRQYPRGDLVEETLALAVEATSALGDPAATSYALQYLQRYPAGRFREQAVRAQLRAVP